MLYARRDPATFSYTAICHYVNVVISSETLQGFCETIRPNLDIGTCIIEFEATFALFQLDGSIVTRIKNRRHLTNNGK